MYVKILIYFLLAIPVYFLALQVTNPLVSVVGGLLLLVITSSLDSEVRGGLKPLWNRFAIRHIYKPRYIYDLLVRSKINHPLTSNEVESMVNTYMGSKGKTVQPNPLYGTNYYQFSTISPPEAIQIRWHEAIGTLEDLDNDEFEAKSYDLLVSLSSPHIARINDLDDRRMEALVTLLWDISSLITEKLGHEGSRILITVNRLEGNAQPSVLRPPSASAIRRYETNGATVLRDEHSLQIFSKDASAVMQSMTKDLDTLVPA